MLEGPDFRSKVQPLCLERLFLDAPLDLEGLTQAPGQRLKFGGFHLMGGLQSGDPGVVGDASLLECSRRAKTSRRMRRSSTEVFAVAESIEADTP